MKTWKQALALVLALVMALSLVALPSFAEGEEESAGDTGMPYINGQGGTVEQNGLVMSKTIKKGENGQFLLTLGPMPPAPPPLPPPKNPWTSSWSWTSPARWTLPYPTTITIILETTTTRLCMI